MPPQEPHKPARPSDGRAGGKGEPAVEKISHFILKRKLGEGAVGQVWLAHDRALDREVAIKLVRSSGANNENQVRAFIREARAAARLNHPNVVMIHHVGQDDGRVFIVMEYVEAGSLGDELGNKGKLSWREATRAVRDAAAGLEAAQQAGLTHRDVKPSNLLRTASGAVKVVDFGLAHNDGADMQATQTQDGVVLGSPAYMSPEQCHGKHVDPRSDLYSLTCTYYHLLTGELPFPGTNMASVMYDHCHGPFPDARKVVQDIPDGVLGILAKGSQKQPQDRFPSAAEMRAGLDAVLAASEPSLTFDSGSDVARWRTKGAMWSAAAAGVIALLAFLIHRAYSPTHGASPTAGAPLIQAAPALAPRALQQRPPNPVVAMEPPVPIPAKANPELLPPPVLTSHLDPSGHRVIDLMPLVDPAQDMSCGRWTLANGALAGTGDDPNEFRTGEPDTKYALFFPYFPPAEYEMRVSFTAQLGQANPELELLLQRSQGAFQLRIDYGPQHLVGFPGFDRTTESADRPSVVPMAEPIAPGRPHQVVVRVRQGPFSAEIDGSSLVNFRPAGKEGGDDDYSRGGGRAEKCLGIAAANGQVVFNAIEVTEVSGPGVVLSRIRRNDSLLRRYAGPRQCDELGFSSDTEHIVGKFPGAVIAWDLARGRARQCRGDILNCDDDRAALAGDHDFLSVLRYDSDVELRRISRRKLLVRPDDSAGLSPDLQLVALWRRSNAQDQLELWDATRDANIRTFEGSGRPAKHGNCFVGFSPDGQFLACQCGDKDRVGIWNVQTGQETASAPSRILIGGPDVRPVFSSNGAYLLFTGKVAGIANDAPWVINARTGVELQLALVRGEGDGVLSPVAPLLLTVIRNNGQSSLHLWDLTTLRGSFPFHDIPSRVNAMAFAPAGDRVLTGSDDGWLRLFDLATGKQIAAFFAHDGSVNRVAYSPDGHFAASAGYDRGICVWKLPGPFAPVPPRLRSAPQPPPPSVVSSTSTPTSRPTLVANTPKVETSPAPAPAPAPTPATRPIAPQPAVGQKIRALIVDGQNTDNWRATTPLLKAALESCGLFTVDIATSPPRGAKMDGFRPEFANYDVIVSNYNGYDWPESTRKAFQDFVTNGRGFVCIRAADNAFPKWTEYNKMIAVGGWGERNETVGPMLRWRDGKVERDKKGGGGATDPPRSFVVQAREPHPITDGLPPRWLHAKDELYTKLCGPAENATILATALSDHTYENEPVMLAVTYGSGRVFHTMLGYNEEAMKDLGFVVTLCRGAEWAATGRVTQPAPPDFPTSEKLRPWYPNGAK